MLHILLLTDWLILSDDDWWSMLLLLNCDRLVLLPPFPFSIIMLPLAKFKLFKLFDDAETDASCIIKLWVVEFSMGADWGAFWLKVLALSCCCNCWNCCCCCWNGEWVVRCNTGKSDGSKVENVGSVTEKKNRNSFKLAGLVWINKIEWG